MKIFSLLLTFNLVMTAAVILLALTAPLLKKMRAGFRLRFHYTLLAFAFVISLGSTFVKGGEVFQPIVKVWSDSTLNSVPAKTRGSTGIMQVHRKNIPVPADYFFLFSVGLCVGAALAAGLYLLRGNIQLKKIIHASHVLRSVGRVRVLVSDDVKIPFSYRSPRFAYVVVPQYLITNPNSLRLTVAHELQHHRQRDTHWAYALMLARAACFINPFVHFWTGWIGEIQEFACDEALVGRHRSLKQAYARCLIEVAETAWVQGSVPAGATGMILLSRGNLLNRRIQVMFKEKYSHGKTAGLATFAVIASLLTATAFAAKGIVQDRRITLAQAQEMVRRSVPKDSAFPVVVNEEVLKYLNHWIGTPDGRRKMRESLQRMENYRVMVEFMIAEYNAPPELMAVPLIESGYQNLPDQNMAGWGAGVWMFIASTARAYGLKVNDHVDQRMNEELETDAAMRLFIANRMRFKDWQLSALAYNAGENAIQQAIFQTGSRDPWDLVRNSELSAEAKNYLPKLMAAIIIMKNPMTVD